MTLPPGYPTSEKHLVCKLKRSLYGLRQASRQWFNKFSSTLKCLGFTQSRHDYSLFTCVLCTSADITYIVHKLSQFMQSPRSPHLKAVHHLLQYLKGTPGQGILFPSDSNLNLTVYSDADWAGCLNTRRSTIGFVIFLSTIVIFHGRNYSINVTLLIECSTFYDNCIL
uniref:Reverse transcriptase Ty1/copia-type domain-containing protein n=1 Tax=Cajanus cajan TaxID=3821 RepID=A0A151TRX7_CAJCA|nr:hypothetical protein KK1_008998 [Cajanus cajan]